MIKPFFSVIMPVFNKAGQMNDSVRSLKEQTFKDFEVVFVNDGSTDTSADELARFCKDDERFRIVTHEKNSSVMTARYTGMKEAKGSYILFLDSDDTYAPYTCEKIHESLQNNLVDIVRFDIIEEPEMYIRHAEDFAEGTFDAYMKGKIDPTVWKNCYSQAVVKKALERIEPFYSNMAEDLFLSTVLYHCAESVSVINDVLYHYNKGTGMSTRRKVSPEKMRRDMNSMVAVEEHLFSYVDRYCPEYHSLAERKMKQNMRYIFINSVLNDDDCVNVMEVLYTLRGGKTQWLYEEACREAIPILVRKKYDLTDRKLELIGVKIEPFKLLGYWWDGEKMISFDEEEL